MKAIKKLFGKRTKSGFTLVEMIISVALLAILLGGMTIVVSPILESFKDEKQSITASNVSNCVQEYVTRSLRNASQILVVSNASYDDTGSATVTAVTDQMLTYLNKMNSDPTNKTHDIGCISLRYVNGQYILCEEPVKPGATTGSSVLTGNSNTAALQGKVYSDSLYDDLYMNVKFEPAMLTVTDPVTGATTVTQGKDVLKTTIQAYTDKDRKAMVFNGSGISELRQIKVQLRAGAKDTNYYIKFLDLGGADDTHKDIYIFYVNRLLKGVK